MPPPAPPGVSWREIRDAEADKILSLDLTACPRVTAWEGFLLGFKALWTAHDGPLPLFRDNTCLLHLQLPPFISLPT